MNTVTVWVEIPVRVSVREYELGVSGSYDDPPYGSSFDIVVESSEEELREAIYREINHDYVEELYLEETEKDMDPDF